MFDDCSDRTSSLSSFTSVMEDDLLSSRVKNEVKSIKKENMWRNCLPLAFIFGNNWKTVRGYASTLDMRVPYHLYRFYKSSDSLSWRSFFVHRWLKIQRRKTTRCKQLPQIYKGVNDPVLEFVDSWIVKLYESQRRILWYPLYPWQEDSSNLSWVPTSTSFVQCLSNLVSPFLRYYHIQYISSCAQVEDASTHLQNGIHDRTGRSVAMIVQKFIVAPI